ncbi:calmodulin-binding transcription activator 2 isoform X2 [Cucumis melo var. makuwa]|uniref:Calmodulin-binding transcription activator 2 isoform X2 n=1 Tax=Cucumis melo var. makuwa TaxID=1194695 RepID=A0A5A7SPL6_CUCMM|nr:calmodulin-binding transcription activator 2 isoform X2 [Cucumis melo var. makuwa]
MADMAYIHADIEQLLIEAKHRWLRPAEICEILRNYTKFRIASEPPDRPSSGSLFLFDRKVLRYFRKDGHKWRKKKDGKTVREAHEKLKVGSIDVLHCYYAHGEENENFQRRSYWMLEEHLMHIVFVHYLEVKGNRTNVGAVVETDEVSTSSQKSSTKSSSYSSSHNQAASENADSPSPTSTLTSFCEDADNEDTYQATSRFHSFPTSPKMGNGLLVNKPDAGQSNFYFPHSSSNNVEGWSSVPAVDYVAQVQKDGLGGNSGDTSMMGSQKTLSSASWEEILHQCTTGYQTVPSHVLTSSIEPLSSGIVIGQENSTPDKILTSNSAIKEDFGNSLTMTSNWQVPFEDNTLSFSKEHVDHFPDLYSVCDIDSRLTAQKSHDATFGSGHEMFCAHPGKQNEEILPNLELQFKEGESYPAMRLSSDNDMPKEGTISYSLTLKQSLIDGEESLKKVDSFSRWVSKELGEVDDLHMHPSSGLSWTTVECGDMVDDSSLSPSISEDQLFSITAFSPKWTVTDLETEVVVIGRFLGNNNGTNCHWSCMFGEVEVPAEVLADGILCCHAPPHSVGRVPFYVTCSNRVACSEVREFDYLAGSAQDVDVTDIYTAGATEELRMHLRFERLLSLEPSDPSNDLSEGALEKQNLIRELITIKEEDDSYGEDPNPQNDQIQHQSKEFLFVKLMKEKLYSWLIHKVIEGGKGPNILDGEGQGVIHLAAALGYDWAIRPIVAAGVSINFRDINGWTALHWAALYFHADDPVSCRELTVVTLITLDASPGLMSDPSPEVPLGIVPADLASINGHKGISGFLAEAALTSYVSSISMAETVDDGVSDVSKTKAVQTVSERKATPVNDGFGDLSLKDSLTAVCNATQAAGRIYQILRVQSFQRKKLSECGTDEFGSSDNSILSFMKARARKSGLSNNPAHAAAVQIQKKFRGWRMRKEFLLIRQRIVKIQAHVRGHQVRKQYRKIVWSVGMIDKIILRWRRKGSGLRGFRSDAVAKDPPSLMAPPTKEDDYDFLKEGRRQTEERFQKALTRVKSMAQYPEGRDQYRRLLTVVQKCRETKGSAMVVTSTSEEVIEGDDMIDIDTLLDDDALMSMTFD